MKLRFEIDGVEDIQHDFENLVSEQKIGRIMEQGAILVEGEAKRMCPVKTGRLMHSITHHRISNFTQEIAATASYADYVEYGTMYMEAGTPESPFTYTSSSGKYPSYRPYLRSALYHNINRIIDYFNKQLTVEE